MRNVHLQLPTAILAAVIMSLATAMADDQDRAREDVAAGRIVPLATVIERATARFGGTIIEAEYESDDDEHGEGGRRKARNRYELRLLTSDGRILELDYDAVTGDLIRQRGRLRERHRWGHGRNEGE